MAKVPENKSDSDTLAFIVEIAALEQKAHQMGYHETGHALNKASQVIGWEVERKLLKDRRGV